MATGRVTYPNVVKAVQDAVEQCGYRVSESRWAGGLHTVAVEVITKKDWRGPNARGNSVKAWSRNGKWSGTNSRHDICVYRTWMKHVRDRGLAVVDGMLTLDLTPAGKDGDAYRAIWARQGRGVDLVTCKGFLARFGDVWAHGSSLRGARATAKKRHKAAQEALEAARAEETAMSTAVVTLAHARAAGLCMTGIKDWLAKRGLPTDTTELPAKEALRLALASGDRVDLVRQAIRKALMERRAA